MLQSSPPERTDAKIAVALRRAYKARFETMMLQAKMVERRIQREHADALRQIAKSP